MISEEILNKIKPGAKVKVYEGKTPFEGIVISRKHGSESGATFVVRAIVARRASVLKKSIRCILLRS